MIGSLGWQELDAATYYEVYQSGRLETAVSSPPATYYHASPRTFLGEFSSTDYQIKARNTAGCSASTPDVVVR